MKEVFVIKRTSPLTIGFYFFFVDRIKEIDHFDGDNIWEPILRVATQYKTYQEAVDKISTIAEKDYFYSIEKYLIK